MFGLLPAIFWLLFWLYEDRKRPEPRGLILRTFIGGMIVVPVVIQLETLGFSYFSFGVASFIIVSVVEEVFKYLEIGRAHV